MEPHAQVRSAAEERPDGVAAIPTIGLFRRTPPVEPRKAASPKENTPPSEANSQ